MDRLVYIRAQYDIIHNITMRAFGERGFPPKRRWHFSRPRKHTRVHVAPASSCRGVMGNKNASKIGNGESIIIAVVYLSRNYKVACVVPRRALSRTDQESPLMRRCLSFPARKRYIILWVYLHATSTRIYIILWLCI